MKVDSSLMFDPVKVSDMAPRLEQAGFDGAYTFEGQNDPFIGLTAAALATDKLELMTSIAVAFARNPMSLAYLGNDLQLVSRGRFTLGLGTQVKGHIERRFGMPWGKPVTRMRDMVLAIKAIWHSWQTGDKLDYRGEYYQHTLMSPTFAPGPNPYGVPKIYMAGVGPAMTAAAAEVADGYFLHPFHSADSYAALTAPALQRGLDTAGKQRADIEISAQVVTATGLDDAALQAALLSARSQVAFYGSTPAYKPVLAVHGWDHMQAKWAGMVRNGEWQAMADSVTDDMLDTFAVVGTPDQVAQQIQRRCGALVDRISPVVYQPDTALLTELLAALRRAAT